MYPFDYSSQTEPLFITSIHSKPHTSTNCIPAELCHVVCSLALPIISLFFYKPCMHGEERKGLAHSHRLSCNVWWWFRYCRRCRQDT